MEKSSKKKKNAFACYLLLLFSVFVFRVENRFSRALSFAVFLILCFSKYHKKKKPKKTIILYMLPAHIPNSKIPPKTKRNEISKHIY